MNSKFIKMLLIGAVTFANAQDNFAEIPSVGAGNRPDGAVDDPNVIVNSDKTITLPLQKRLSHKEMIKEQVFRHHLMVQSTDRFNASSRNGRGVSDSKDGAANAQKQADALEFDIIDHKNNYFTTMFIGSNAEKVNVAFSTSDRISIIASANCQGCDHTENKGFEYQRSHTIRKISEKIIEYGVGPKTIAKGVLVYDDVKLNKDAEQAIREFSFLLVNTWEQNNFQKVDGIIGLSRSFYSADGQNSGPALLNNLYQQGQINQKVFAVHFDDFGGSVLQLGGYDQSKIAPGKQLQYLETPYDKDWKLSINAFRVTDKPKFDNGAKSAYYFEEKEAIIDTFSPYIKLPKSIGVQAFAKFVHDVKYNNRNGLLQGSCDLTKYHTISLFVNDRYYVKMVPDAYVIDIGEGDNCYLPFQYNNEDKWVLGEPFFRSFYTVFDDAKGLIGMAPSAKFTHASITEGSVPNDELMHPVDKSKPKLPRNQLPSSSDPLGMAVYFMNSVEHKLFDGGADTVWTWIAIVAVILVTLCVFGVVIGTSAYFIWQYFKYSNATTPPPAAPVDKSGTEMAPANTTPKVRSSNPARSKSGAGDGPKNKLLSASQIQQRIDELNSRKMVNTQSLFDTASLAPFEFRAPPNSILATQNSMI